MPSLSKAPGPTPEQDNAAVSNYYRELQMELLIEVFGPNYDFERLLFLHRTMNALERRAPWLQRRLR
jgi:hypothetical protein